jgi:hypothetical protein
LVRDLFTLEETKDTINEMMDLFGSPLIGITFQLNPIHTLGNKINEFIELGGLEKLIHLLCISDENAQEAILLVLLEVLQVSCQVKILIST